MRAPHLVPAANYFVEVGPGCLPGGVVGRGSPAIWFVGEVPRMWIASRCSIHRS